LRGLERYLVGQCSQSTGNICTQCIMLNQTDIAIQLMKSKVIEGAGEVPLGDCGEDLKPHFGPHIDQGFGYCTSTGGMTKPVRSHKQGD